MRLFQMLIAAILLVFTGSANAEVLTGCITSGSTLKNVAKGEEPSKPCGPGDLQVQWEVVNGVAEASCPCDFKSKVTWAGWYIPVCEYIPRYTGLELRYFELRLFESEIVSGAQMPSLLISKSLLSGRLACQMHSTSFLTEYIDSDTEEFTTDQFEACLLDLDEVASALGLGEGCKVPE